MHLHNHHNHEHHHSLTQVNKAFIWGISLNSAFILIEIFAGFYYNSLALLSDAWHNVNDVASLFIAFLSIKFAQKKPNSKFTYGFKKATVLAAFINSVLLLAAIILIIYDGIHRLFNPVEVKGNAIVLVALAGIIINSLSAYFLLSHKENDLNIKAAFWHLVADALISVGVVISGLLIIFTKNFIFDPLMSIIISIIIFFSAWNLLKKSVFMNLDAVPDNIDVEKIKQNLYKLSFVKDVHHIHIWNLSTNEIAFTGHIVIPENYPIDKAKAEVKKILKQNGIQHTTIEIELENENCQDNCN